MVRDPTYFVPSGELGMATLHLSEDTGGETCYLGDLNRSEMM